MQAEVPVWCRFGNSRFLISVRFAGNYTGVTVPKVPKVSYYLGMRKDGAQELARLVKHNRRMLGMHTQADLADALGLTVKTVGNIERAAKGNYSALTLARLERLFEWPIGAAEKVLETGEAPDLEAKSAPVGLTWADFEEAWDSVPVGNSRILRVFAAYDPTKVDDEDLARIALNARHYMRKELDEASGTNEEPKPEPVTPFPAQAGRTADLDTIAANLPQEVYGGTPPPDPDDYGVYAQLGDVEAEQEASQEMP